MIYMITEDYISFDAAKLMKEKGFNEIKCNTCYKWNGNFCNNRRTMSGIDNEICYQAPTLQMAMKWLRKVHKIYMYVAHDSMENTWFARVYNDYKTLSDVDNHSTYEEACEAAIKYCLEKLI